MKAAQLLDAAKERLSLKSDYALAKASGINRSWITGFRNGSRAVPLHLAYWLAITLERDPAALVAELEEEREKHEGRKAFWKSFLSRVAVQMLACYTLVFASFGTGGNAQAGIGGNKPSSDNLYYVK